MFDRTTSTLANVDPEIAAAIVEPRTGARKTTSS